MEAAQYTRLVGHGATQSVILSGPEHIFFFAKKKPCCKWGLAPGQALDASFTYKPVDVIDFGSDKSSRKHDYFDVRLQQIHKDAEWENGEFDVGFFFFFFFFFSHFKCGSLEMQLSLEGGSGCGVMLGH